MLAHPAGEPHAQNRPDGTLRQPGESCSGSPSLQRMATTRNNPREPSTCRKQGCSLIQPASHMLKTGRKAPFPATGSDHERVASAMHKTTPCTTLLFSEPRLPAHRAPYRPVSRHRQQSSHLINMPCKPVAQANDKIG